MPWLKGVAVASSIARVAQSCIRIPSFQQRNFDFGSSLTSVASKFAPQSFVLQIIDQFSSQIANQHDVACGISSLEAVSSKDLCFLSSSSAGIQIHVEGCKPESRGKELGEESLRFTLDRLPEPDTELDSATYASLLRWCGESKALPQGRSVHGHILKRGREGDLYLGNLLVQMYGKCEALTDAMGLFSNMIQRDLFSWTFIIAAYAQHWDDKTAAELFQRMQLEGSMPNRFTFLGLLSAFVSDRGLAKGKQIHACIAGCQFDSNVVLETALIHMYGKCGCLMVARVVFDEMPARDIISWNAMIAAYSQHGHGREALQLLLRMKEEGVLANKVTFVSTVDAFAGRAFLIQGQVIHVHIVQTGFESSIVVGNALINMYSRCASLEAARKMFDNLIERNVVSWTSMIAAYAKHGYFKNALQLFNQMQAEGILANKLTFVGILSACSIQACLAEAKRFHTFIEETGLESDIVVGNALLNMYGRCKSLEDAHSFFSKMLEKDSYSWSTMITAYVQHGQAKGALQLFEQMQSQGLMPNKVTFVTVLSAVSSQKALVNGKQMHNNIVIGGFDLDVVVGTALVGMYGSCGSTADAQRVFDRVPQQDGVLWNAMIAAHAQHGQTKKALALYHQMQLESLIPEKFTFFIIMDACASHAVLMESRRIHAQTLANRLQPVLAVETALVNMYAKAGSMDDAHVIFDGMSEKDKAVWIAMIAGHARHGQHKKALNFFLQMQSEAVLPDEMTYSSMLSACANEAALAEGKRRHAGIVGSPFQADVVVGNALINMYSKCGSLENTKSTFESMMKRDVISWTAMISAYSQHGQGKHALQLLKQMQQEGKSPNEITFLSILYVCSHTGLVDEACCYFVSMEQIYGISPFVEHFNCLIDLLGRVGQLDDVMCLIQSMPFQPTATSWMTLLGARRMHLDVK